MRLRGLVGFLVAGFVLSQCSKKTIDLEHADDAGANGAGMDSGGSGDAPGSGGTAGSGGPGRGGANQGGSNQGGSRGGTNQGGGDNGGGSGGASGTGTMGGNGGAGAGGSGNRGGSMVGGAGLGGRGGAAGFGFDGNPGVSGTAGVPGPGGAGAGGTGGSAGMVNACEPMGGAGGSISPGCPVCPTGPKSNAMEGCVLSGGTVLTGGLTAALTVTAVNQVPSGSCGNLTGGGVSSSAATRIDLQADDQRAFTLVVRMPDYPDSLIRVGDRVDLTLTAEPGGGFVSQGLQELVVKKGGNLVVVAFTGPQPRGALLALNDIEFTDAGRMCAVVRCGFVDHRSKVVVGASEAIFEPGQTKDVGSLHVTVDRFDHWQGNGGCDSVGVAEMAGFVRP